MKSERELARTPAPAATWHAAKCFHKWCNCYDAKSHEQDGDCKHCRRRRRNKEASK